MPCTNKTKEKKKKQEILYTLCYTYIRYYTVRYSLETKTEKIKTIKLKKKNFQKILVYYNNNKVYKQRMVETRRYGYDDGTAKEARGVYFFVGCGGISGRVRIDL